MSTTIFSAIFHGEKVTGVSAAAKVASKEISIRVNPRYV